MQGSDIGLLARELFPSGVDATPVDHFHYRESIADTAEFIRQGHNIIFEAAFQYDGVMCAIDVLVKFQDKWYGYEIKSSTSVKEQFLQDAALQYYVINNAGLKLEDIFLVHINNQYIRKGELELKGLFTKHSLKEEVLSRQPFVAKKISELVSVVADKEMPVIATGDHCTSPYTCDFNSFCQIDQSADITEGTFERVAADKIKVFLARLEYPLYFLSLQTYMVAVPEYNGHWPYRPIPYMFSLVKRNESGAISEQSYLAEPGCDPCPTLISSFTESLENAGSVVVANPGSLYIRLRELKNDYPEFEEALSAIQKRLIGLPLPYEMEDGHSLFQPRPLYCKYLQEEATSTIINDHHCSALFYNLKSVQNSAAISETKKQLLNYSQDESRLLYNVYEKYKNDIYLQKC